jgi:hypothetical protein
LLSEFDRIIDRLKAARAEYVDKVNVNYSAITEAYKVFRFTCERCGNKVGLFVRYDVLKSLQ